MFKKLHGNQYYGSSLFDEFHSYLLLICWLVLSQRADIWWSK